MFERTRVRADQLTVGDYILVREKPFRVTYAAKSRGTNVELHLAPMISLMGSGREITKFHLRNQPLLKVA